MEYLDSFLNALSTALGYLLVIATTLLLLIDRIKGFLAKAVHIFPQGSAPDDVIEMIYAKVDFIDDYITPANIAKAEKLKDKLDAYRRDTVPRIPKATPHKSRSRR